MASSVQTSDTRKLLEGEGTADNPAVIDILRNAFLIPPSKEEYNLKNPENLNPSMGQAQAVDYILKGKVKKLTVGPFV